MPFPLIAVAGAVARALPMIASTAGRAAASGAVRMGASEGVSSMVGRGAQSATKMGMQSLMSPKESRTHSFSQGATSAQSGGMGSLPFTPDSLPSGSY